VRVVYLDLLFAVNLIANYLLLLITARIGGGGIRKLPFFLSALFGSGYASIQICGLDFLGHPLCKLGAGALMPLIAWGNKRGLLRYTLLFFGASAALGGMVWAVELFGGSRLTLEHGVLYSWIDVRLLLLILILSYGAIVAIFDRIFVHSRREMVDIHITVGERTVTLVGLLDTGNTLTEPATNRPVLVADGRALRNVIPRDLSLERPIEAMEKLNENNVKGFYLLPYRAVGIKNGMLLAVRADRVEIGKRLKRNVLIALSPTPISDGGGYQALIGGNLWD